MNARERAEAWYHGYDADDKGELLEGLAAQFEAAERAAWNAAIEAAAETANYYDWGDTAKSETARKIRAEIKRLTK